MSDLTDFHDHCRRMARSLHLPDCPSQRPPPIAFAPGVATVTITACMGCVPKTDRALWIRLADEVAAYLTHAEEAPLW